MGRVSWQEGVSCPLSDWLKNKDPLILVLRRVKVQSTQQEYNAILPPVIDSNGIYSIINSFRPRSFQQSSLSSYRDWTEQ